MSGLVAAWHCTAIPENEWNFNHWTLGKHTYYSDIGRQTVGCMTYSIGAAL